MTNDTTHRAFFGDAERSFALTPAMILELERITGTGIGALIRRVFAADYRHADLVEVIRLALVGAGADPKEAASLVAAYATPRPLGEVFPLAVAILEALWFGPPKPEQPAEPAPAPLGEEVAPHVYRSPDGRRVTLDADALFEGEVGGADVAGNPS